MKKFHYQWKTKINKYKWGQIGTFDSKLRKNLKAEEIKKHQIKYNKDGYWPFTINAEGKGLAKTEAFEFKYWAFPATEKSIKVKGKPHEPKFQCCATEYNFIIEGKIKGQVGKTKNIILKAGDYIVIKPGFPVDLQQVVMEDVKGITIKTPSRKGDTIKKNHCEKLFNNFR